MLLLQWKSREDCLGFPPGMCLPNLHILHSDLLAKEPESRVSMDLQMAYALNLLYLCHLDPEISKFMTFYANLEKASKQLWAMILQTEIPPYLCL